MGDRTTANRRKITDLLQTADRLIMVGEFDKALKQVELALGIDPGDTYAHTFKLRIIKLKAEKQREVKKEPRESKATIVVVDDDELTSEFIRSNLEKLGYTVKTFISGKDALGYIKSSQPDLILSDVAFEQGMTGYEFCEALRKDPRLAAVPLILMSQRANEVLTHVGEDFSIDEYITKPIDPDALLDSIKAKLHQHRHDVALVEKEGKSALTLIEDWLSEEGGYDEHVWPRLKQAIEENRSSYRKLFNG